MNSADDSTVVTPADTSNLSSPDSTSSEFSQPTVKMRVNRDPKNRPIDHRIFAADGHDPFLQTLDRDGRRLVETTGRTAQRSRASRCSERSTPEKSKVDRWPSYHQPRKCRSSTSANSFERRGNRGLKKRHSYNSDSSGRCWDKRDINEAPKSQPIFAESIESTGQLEESKVDRRASRRLKKRHSYDSDSSGRCRDKPDIINEAPKRQPIFAESIGSTGRPDESKIDRWPSYHQPRKCQSSTTASSFDRRANRRLKKRHSYGSESSRRSWENPSIKETPKRYSAGDYLRQQILEDLNSAELAGKTDEQIAEDRCNRVKAYLRGRGNDSPHVAPETRLRELREWTRSAHAAAAAKANRRRDLDRVRSYLEEKIQARMDQERWRNSGTSRWSPSHVDEPNELSIRDIKTRYPDYKQDRSIHPTRRVRSDVNVTSFGRDHSSSDSERDDKKMVPPWASSGGQRRGKPCRRTRSEIVPEMLIDYDDNEIKTRFYSFLGERRNSWKTKSGLTFEKKLSLPSGTQVSLEPESAEPGSEERDDRGETNHDDGPGATGKNSKKYCRRTRSEATDRSTEIRGDGRRAKRRSVSWSDRRKSRRKTSAKSTVIPDSTSVDTEAEAATRGPAKSRRVRSLCSWREYKERRRREQLRRELAGAAGDERSRDVDLSPLPARRLFGGSTPVSRSRANGDGDASRVSLGTENTGNPENEEEGKKREQSPGFFAGDATGRNENSLEPVRSSDNNANDTETETILQENYLLLDLEESRIDSDYRSPTISRVQVNEYPGYSPLCCDQRRKIGCDTVAAIPGAKSGRIGLNLQSNIGNDYQKDREIGWDRTTAIPGAKSGQMGFNLQSNIGNDDRKDREIGCNTTTAIPETKSGRIGFNLHSNVRKSDTFRIVDGSEGTIDDDRGTREKGEPTWGPNDPNRFFVADDGDDDAARAGGTFGGGSEGDDDSAVGRNEKDVATDYFRRVYELLKRRQEYARRGERPGASAAGRRDSDTSTAACDERDELRRQRRRRRRRDRNCQGEDVVAVPPGVRGDDDWRVQQLLVNNDPENLIFRRPQLQNTGQKRPRHPAPPIPANCKINAKDISKYFDYPNKENSPRNGVNENGRSKRNELIEQQQQQQQQQHQQIDSNESAMGSNLSRHNGKGLTGRRTQSSGNLCDPKGKLNHVGKILVPCSSTQRERYKICGSLPNHLDDKEILDDDDPRENNNTISDTMVGSFGGTLPHKKRSLGVHFSDTGPTGTLDLVKHRSQDSLEGDPWRYQEGVDLDLVRCKHGNYDVVRKNPSADVVDGDSSGRAYGTLGRSTEGRCFRGADLDLVGTLPKRRVGEPAGSALRQSFEARQNRAGDRTDDLLIKVLHKPDCELAKRHQFDRVVDLKLGRLAGGEPQDQGYASERSPEDEHPPSLPGQPFPKVTPEDTFCVTLQKSSRGLGLSVSGGGTAGPVRVKRLFPQQPAALSKKLQSGDILLAANGVPLTGLTNYEALEVLRTTPSTVELVVCRVPGDTSVTSPGAPPPPPARREPPSSLRILNPQPPLQIEPCGEFDIEMTKVAGSLGFTLRKVDSSALGHYVRALVREPALSDGRIQPGDKIVSVDGEPLSPMSHEEAVALLRQCGPRVKLRLYRDLAQTPVSALSPTEPDHPLRPPRTSLRQEAVDMLCDLAVRKLSPDASNGANNRQTSAASCHSPRRLRKPLSRTPTTENDNENHLTFHPVHPPTSSQAEASDTDQCSINTQATNSQSETPANDIIDPPPLYDVCDSSDSSRALSRPSFLDLTARPEKPHFRFSLESESDYTGPIVVTESDSNLTAECDYDDELAKDAPPALSSDEQDNNLPSEPASMPPLLSTTRTTSGAFSYKNPAYQSANPTCGGIDNSAKNKNAHSSDHDIPGKVLGAEDPAGSKGLLKWKGVMFAPNDEADETGEKAEPEEAEKPSATEVSARNAVPEDGNEVFTVELTRGWNSRLGFSLQPEGNSTVISVVHPDSVAAKDGRLMEGDVLIMVNDESVENMPTAEIIDLLRKIRGSIGITVRRKNRTKNVT